MDHFKAKFLHEAEDLLAELEKAILSLEENIQDASQIEQVFRIMHTFKGNSTMFGYMHVGEFTHHLETIYDSVRSGKDAMSRDILTITLDSVDHIRTLLKEEEKMDQELKAKHERLTASLVSLTSPSGSPHQTATTNTTPGQLETGLCTFFISFRPQATIQHNGTNPLYLVDDVAQLGKTKMFPVYRALPAAEVLDTALCYLSWNMLLAYKDVPSDIQEVFMFAEDQCQLDIVKLADESLLEDETFLLEASQLLDNNAQVDLEGLKSTASIFSIAGKKAKKQALKEQFIPKSAQGTKEANGASIRVSSEKLDSLMNLVSELVTTQARLSLFAEHNSQTELISIAENVEKISRQLRDNTFSICLVPIESVITRFKRLIRDLSTELNKDVNFVTEGTETELDKTIIDRLSDPLLHILRNSMDHGIEEAHVRAQTGKPAKATILFKAYYSGTNVHIEVHDDGAGIDPKKIRDKAVQKGLISADATLSEKEILELIFLPGFSTASKITEVSGRGVGMDVVKRGIQDLRGDVSLQSVVGQGTKLTIKLPLTLSIIDGLLVKINHTHFVIPLVDIDKCYEARHEQLTHRFNDLIVLDGEQVPYIYLREEFNIHDNVPDIEQVVIVKHEDQRIGLTVDSIVGEYQAVLKPLGKLYKNLHIISGATILGDGSIALVIDTHQIIKQYTSQSKKKELSYEH